MPALRIHAAAAEEAIEAAAWYENEQGGLGADFERAINAALDLLEQNVVPLTSMPGIAGARGIKRLFLKRFPYAVVIHKNKDEIFVLAFAHHMRRPGYWRDRLPKA
jgi:toxin ParE1/3/4